MQAMNYLYLAPGQCLGPDWSIEFDQDGQLPPVSELMERLGDRGFQGAKLSLLLQDDLLHPLRVRLEEPVPAKEREHHLLWKLKRYLPYPIDQVAMRYLPLLETNSFLTFSLPRAWLNGLFDGFRERGGEAGYIGGLFITLLENRPAFSATLSIGIFSDFYLVTERDEHGGYLDFRTRRLPFTDSGELDVETLLHSDLIPMMTRPGPAVILNFAPGLDAAFGDISSALKSADGSVRIPRLEGSILQRFASSMNLPVGAS